MVLENDIVGFDQDYLDDKYVKYDEPSETEMNFSEEEFIQRVEKIKDYLHQMEKHNSSITKYGKTFANFYTLWSIIALSHDGLPEASEFAERYNEFMLKVKELADADEPEELLGSNGEKYKNPFIYFINVRGATTEIPQRTERDRTLKVEILQE